MPDTNGVKLSRPNFLSKFFLSNYLLLLAGKRQNDTERIRPYRCSDRITACSQSSFDKTHHRNFVVMKAQFSEVYYNKSHSENSGNSSTGSSYGGAVVMALRWRE